MEEQHFECLLLRLQRGADFILRISIGWHLTPHFSASAPVRQAFSLKGQQSSLGDKIKEACISREQVHLRDKDILETSISQDQDRVSPKPQATRPIRPEAREGDLTGVLSLNQTQACGLTIYKVGGAGAEA